MGVPQQPPAGSAPSVGAAAGRIDRTLALTDGVSRLRYVSSRGTSSRLEALERLGIHRVRDLFLIRIARLGYRKEGTPEEDKNDLRLVFEVQFVNQLFDDYKPVELKIWRTFTDTTIGKLIKQAYA